MQETLEKEVVKTATPVVKPYEISFELDGLPDMVNAKRRYSHWRDMHKQAKLWKELVYYKVFRVRPKAPLKKAKLLLVRHSSNEPDYEGLVSGFKHIIDGLVEAGIIANDKMTNIGRPEYLWEKASPKEGKISIKVTSVDI